ncbi:hypothetical protein EGJ27_18895 [Pseudomonas sp. v388]|uniref:hypothetical protein n=1 Tax=Pseudomonas sp. v388 TaxID=2479849 RepID=UPI000F773283|nr:hypothetical protein [Pseudomonas sp. v388]RRV05240.1 hypothetical protein EGJ27_18895 [Pseudomonas sp. v388]
MSLNSVQSPVAQHQFATPLLDEMQREDFLALAAALRQFNAYESQITKVIETARSCSAGE